MSNKAIQQLLEIKENYLKNNDIEQLQNSIKELPPEMIELFNVMSKKLSTGVKVYITYTARNHN